MAAGTQVIWQTGRVVEVAAVAEGIRRIVLETRTGQRAAPGAHVDVRVPSEERTDTRSYSVVSQSEDGRRTTLSVQLAPQSRGGSVFMHGLGLGDEVQISEPLQNFPLRVDAERYVLLAGGIGITAIAAMARVLRRLKRDYVLVYVGRSRSRMAYLEQLQELHGDRLRVHVDDEGTGLDAAALVDEIAGNGPTELYMCGPIPLMDAVRRRWHEARLPVTDLRYETFGNSGWFEPEAFVVAVPRLGIQATVDADRSMLEALEEAGADMMSDCRKGECGLCQVEVLDLQGRIDHRDVFFSDEQKQGLKKVLTCVSRVVRGRADGSEEATGPSGAPGPAVLSIEIP